MNVGWGRPFDEPIEIPGGELATLLDAGRYIAKLSLRDAITEVMIDARVHPRPKGGCSEG
ncbi:hypothetical protein [Bradyrhizobium sp. CW1]|uniref:hypothetical protein n=1 Tax=Bradyrhizobium sp. CW1 TaxID=2782686 RepID=UPI001FFF623C|nr:hypothetical protein [Bradyrhizobium sp. CW1]UPJ25407.1 hypothetical protein IVB54_26570 [Bradyrhizobium sp. CW1]